MTLRTRLTVAFLAVVLGPVLLSALFVGASVTAVDEDRAEYQLDLAADAVRGAVTSLCRELRDDAEALALLPAGERATAAADLIASGRAETIELRAGGLPAVTAGAAPPRPWAGCAEAAPVTTRPYGAIAARVLVRDGTGRQVGVAYAAARLDRELLAGLAGVTQVQVLLDTGAGMAAEGRWVRRLAPTDGQPLRLVLATPRTEPEGLFALLAVVVVVAGLLAVAAAWWLARSSTRPLTVLARAVDRVADGDLSARVPVAADDEAGRVAAAFNRMTQRMQGYVHALTAGRDQLRGHLTMLGDALSSTHDLPRILRVILRTAVVATGARAGAVALVDSRGEALTGFYAEPGAAGQAEPEGQVDDAGDPTEPVQVPLAGSLLGAVVSSGEASRGRADTAPHRHADEPACRTYLAVPISVPDGTATRTPPWPVPRALRGVLALYDRLGGEDFDEADLAMLRTFAAQAAVAVENVRVHEEAQRLSLTDPLTGLWNYRYLREVLRRELERASRFGRTLAVLALDLDRFKEVNDLYGHPAGDSVLVEFARRIRSGIRDMDLAFRQGGEEFVVLLPETEQRGGETVARRLLAAVRDEPVVIVPRGSVEERPIDVTVSIGIALYPDHGRNAQAVLDAADDALYAAKAAGRDTHRIATTVQESAVAAELPVRAGARTPTDDLPQAGGSRQAGGEPKPPQQSRGR